MYDRIGTRLAGTLPVHLPRPLERPGVADRLLALQQSHGNRAVQRLLAGSAPAAPVLQRQIRITPDDYAAGLGVPALTQPQLRDYLVFAVVDELAHARAHSATNWIAQDEGAVPDWAALLAPITSRTTTLPEKLVAATALVTAVNTYESAHMADRANRDTRYASEPKHGYAHGTGGAPAWRDDDQMWKEFGAGFSPARPGLATTAPAGRGLIPLPKLPWATAKQLLPRPLLNLIFDVRFQLESGGRTVIDERTQKQQDDRDRSPNEPGTLRSWHQDSPGLLPDNGFDDEPPEHGRALHGHYATTSQTGAGSSIGDGATGPTGFAEYTGTGSNWEHNTKVVLDYVGKRVYLTLTHYQYWAMVDGGGTPELFNTETQELVQAQLRVSDHLKDKGLTADKATMMSPWMEVLFT